MKCPTCSAAGVESRVIELPQTVAHPHNAVEYFDEAGEFHRHDLFSVRTPLRCSEGHQWDHFSKVRCPVCNVVVDPTGHDEFGRPR